MIEKSEDIKAISAALLKAQKEIGAALKNAKNPYFKSNYADMKAVIDAIKEPLNKNGITFLQAVNGTGEGMPVVETLLLHESGQYLCSKAPVYCQKPNDPQAFGTGITYTKRYALQAFLGLPTEDDDGNAASAKNSKDSKQKPKEKFQDVLDKAFDEYNKVVLPMLEDGNNTIDRDKFIKAIQKEFGKLPTTVQSIPLIIKKIKLVDILAEKKAEPEKPKPDEKNEIVEQAFFNFTTEQKENLPEGFLYDAELYEKAIIKHFKKLPTNEASVKKINATITPNEVMVEMTEIPF